MTYGFAVPVLDHCMCTSVQLCAIALQAFFLSVCIQWIYPYHRHKEEFGSQTSPDLRPQC